MSEPKKPPATFRDRVAVDAAHALRAVVGEDRARESAGRLALAFDAALRSAADPKALLACSPASVGNCIAMSAITQLYPGGPSPDVYLVPRNGVLSWSLTHVGMAKLAARQGLALLPVPVHREDHLVVGYGEAVEHRQDRRRSPSSLADLDGVIVVLRRVSDGVILARPYIAGDVIQARRSASSYGKVWQAWPVEMAMKTAIKYCYARGMLPITGDDWTAAAAADHEAEMLDVESAPVAAPEPRQSTRALLTDDYTPAPDFAAENERLADRETVAAAPAPAKRARAKVAPAPDLAAVLASGGATIDDLDRWRGEQGKPPVSDLTDDQRAQLATWLAADPARVAALLPAPEPEDEDGAGPMPWDNDAFGGDR